MFYLSSISGANRYYYRAGKWTLDFDQCDKFESYDLACKRLQLIKARKIKCPENVSIDRDYYGVAA